MKNLKHISRKLRKEMTEAEKKLWQYLRAKQVFGIKFRRQQQINNYIVDFYCPSKRIIIELDGGQHANNIKDKERDKFMEDKGIKVIRIWDNDIMNNIEGVMEHIMNIIKNRVDSYRYYRKNFPLPRRERIKERVKKRQEMRDDRTGKVSKTAAASPPSQPSPIEGEGIKLFLKKIPSPSTGEG